MKKFPGSGQPLSLGLCLLLVSLLLVACGDSSPALTSSQSGSPNTVQATATASDTSTTDGSSTTSATGATAASATPAASSSVTATVAVIDPSLKGTLTVWEALPSGQSAVWQNLTATFVKAYPGVKINTQHYDSDELIYAAKQVTTPADLPDLILTSADYLSDLQSAKAIQPADKVLDKDFLASYVPGALAGTTASGSQWGVPFTYSGGIVMLYNKKLVPTPPTTWTDLGKVVLPLYDPKAKKIGLALDINEPFFLTSMLGAYGGNVLNSQNQPTLDTPQMTNALQFIQQLQKNKTIQADSRLQDNQIEYAFRDGRLGVYIGSDALITQYVTGIHPTDPAATLDMGIAPLPQMDANGQSPAPYNDGENFFLGAGTTGTQLTIAKTFLSWLNQPAQQNTILTRARLLPATQAFLNSSTVKDDSVWSGLLAAMNSTKPVPTASQMAVVWTVLRPNLEGVVAGTLNPADAAKQMQQQAESKLQ